MAFKIHGFGSDVISKKEVPAVDEPPKNLTRRKSLIQVQFPGKGMALTYFNDLFDLKVGDFVYVDGKMEGQLGRVAEITYNFKIKLAEYKKVIAVVDTDVHGEFCMAGSHFVTFDPIALPVSQAALWFMAPPKEDEVIISGTDDTVFRLDDLKSMNISASVAERGHEYYAENRVRYLCLQGAMGFAIVEGSQNYSVEFEYRDGEISHLICDCPCGYTCKHAFAAMLQLKETLALIEKYYTREYRRTDYFAAIDKATLFTYAICHKENGKFVL